MGQLANQSFSGRRAKSSDSVSAMGRFLNIKAKGVYKIKSIIGALKANKVPDLSSCHIGAIMQDKNVLNSV